MVNTNANYIIGPTKEKIRESYRDFREKKKEMARTASTTFFHALFRSSFSDENRACEKYIAHSRKESKDRSSIHRSSSGSSVPRWDAGWVEKDFFFFRNKYGMIMEWPKRLERMIDRTITFLFLFLFLFFFFFSSTLIDARRGIRGKKRKRNGLGGRLRSDRKKKKKKKEK